MNKASRILLAVFVLAFAAAGLYYAWFSPTKPMVEKVDLQKQSGPKVTTNQGMPSEDVKDPPRNAVIDTQPAAPVSVSSTVPAPAAPPEAAFNATTPATVPPGFKSDNPPMKTLPSTLPGFTPVTASGAPAKPADTSANPATVAPPATPDKNSAPASGSTTPVAGDSSSKKMPETKPATRAADAPATKSSAAPATSSPATIHEVVEGETLSSIARKYWGSAQGWEAIVKANPGVSPNALKVGTKLTIPPKDAAAAPAVKAAGSTASSGVKPAGTAASPGKTTEYEVVSGDTLSRISNAVYGDSRFWKQIYDANKKTIGDDPAALAVGMKLTIPPKPDAAATSAKTTAKPS